MSKMEGDKKPYQPTEEEMRMAESMVPDDINKDHSGRSMRERILVGRNIRGERMKESLTTGWEEIDDIDVRDGKVLATRDMDTREQDGGDWKLVEISFEDALTSLDKDEKMLNNYIDDFQAAKHRIQQVRQQVMELKEGKEKK